MHEEEKHLHIEFFTDAVENIRKSKEAGRAIFDEVEMIKIRTAGDKNNVLVNPVDANCVYRLGGQTIHATYAQRFADRYDMWRKEKQNTLDGTPLSQLPGLGAARREELKALAIHTIEALAHLDGANLTRLGMGGRDLKNKAQVYLDSLSGTADSMKLVAKNEDLQRQLDDMKAQMADLARASATRPQATVPAAAKPSPFDDWEDDDIINWIVESGGEKPHHKSGHAKIVQTADELNDKIAKAKEQAA